MTGRTAVAWRPVLTAAAAAVAVASVGGLMTETGAWYRSLEKPSWQPPDWLFAPAWTVIFALTAAAGVLGWRHAPGTSERTRVIVLFAANAFLNVFWSALFFRMQRPDWALAEVALLWLSILVLIVVLARFAVPAALLLLPYLAWVSFAAVLNLAIVDLNRSFGA